MFATSQQAISAASIKVQLSHIENWQWNLNMKMYDWENSLEAELMLTGQAI